MEHIQFACCLIIRVVSGGNSEVWLSIYPIHWVIKCNQWVDVLLTVVTLSVSSILLLIFLSVDPIARLERGITFCISFLFLIVPLTGSISNSAFFHLEKYSLTLLLPYLWFDTLVILWCSCSFMPGLVFLKSCSMSSKRSSVTCDSNPGRRSVGFYVFMCFMEGVTQMI